MKLSINAKRSLFSVIALSSALMAPAAAQAASQASVDKAYRFLQNTDRGHEMLTFLHFGATYLSHSYIGGNAYDDGSFRLIFKFRWNTTEDGFTDVAFFCDANGNFRNLEAIRTDAIINQPFAMADLSVKLLGQIIIDGYKDKISADDRRRLQRLVDDADSHKLLEWSLRAEQFFGN
jgi:hypothetical protein